MRDGQRASIMKSVKSLVMAAALVGAAGAAVAEEGGAHSQPKPPRQQWSFAGAFGSFDQAQLKRGFKVYKEVCASCHSLSRVAFRNLAEKGGPELSEAQAKEIAESYKIKDGPNDAGDYFERPGRLSDHFPPPFPNEQAARAAMNGAYPPDMSVLAKARGYSRGFPLFLADALPGFSYQEHGVDYIVALLGGYTDAPHGVELPPGQYYNVYMTGHRIGMPPPLSDGVVTYDDGAPQTVDQYAKDIAAFLMWTAEPHLEERKSIGLKIVGFLIVLSFLVYFTKRKIWANVHH
ncbi:cytochrome c1 [Methylosinus sp. LW4]|nr:cytochrome c1 [Methylosinus sp. LW4]